MSGTDILPYEKDHQVREAMRCLLQASTPVKERKIILMRLLASPELAVSHLPLIFGNLHNKSSELQDIAFQLATQFNDRGFDISCIAADLASHLTSACPAHRQGAAYLLERLGTSAKGAEDFALGCLRNREKDIVISGLRILRAIGPALSRGIANRVSAVFELFPKEQKIGDFAREILDLINAQGGGLSILSSIDRTHLAGKHCLVIEDSAPFRQTMRSALETFGVLVTEAENGKDALRLLTPGDEFVPDFALVLLDIRLPDINGIRILQHIRQQPQTRNLPVVALSGINNDGIISTARQLGISEFIIKSTEMGITLKLIANVLEASGSHA